MNKFEQLFDTKKIDKFVRLFSVKYYYEKKSDRFGLIDAFSAKNRKM